MAEAGARLAIRLLQDAAERGEIDPWDVDVIGVVDGFLDQLRQRVEVPRLMAAAGGSYEQDLAETSEAFLAASVLVGLKAELLEAATFPPEPLADDGDPDEAEEPWLSAAATLPLRPERHLRRRPVAPPPLQRPITLGELIRQLEDIAEQLEREPTRGPRAVRSRRFSDRAAIAQVAALAHREKLPETTAALSRFLQSWEGSEVLVWVGFEELVEGWGASVREREAEEELDADRVGVFWALLFLCSQGTIELEQEGGLFGPLRLRRAPESERSQPLPLKPAVGSALGPARDGMAA
ncbi:MAG: segregation/condensation protein A [Synechococcaceae cyanobacterium]|nr:segregation/condensation protein A [Synechococcaceae cyanobacterium]